MTALSLGISIIHRHKKGALEGAPAVKLFFWLVTTAHKNIADFTRIYRRITVVSIIPVTLICPDSDAVTETKRCLVYPAMADKKYANQEFRLLSFGFEMPLFTGFCRFLPSGFLRTFIDMNLTKMTKCGKT